MPLKAQPVQLDDVFANDPPESTSFSVSRFPDQHEILPNKSTDFYEELARLKTLPISAANSGVSDTFSSFPRKHLIALNAYNKQKGKKSMKCGRKVENNPSSVSA